MIVSKSELKTPNAKKYLRQMCKHFAHKVPVEYSDEEGICNIPAGQVRLYADDQTLRFEIEVDQDNDLERTKYLIESHFVRFAFRENIESLDWSV